MGRVIIVGGGLTGILAALQAHRLGAERIELHERFDQLGGIALPTRRNGCEMREGCIYFGPKGDPIRTLLEANGVDFESFDNRFGSVNGRGPDLTYIDDFGRPAFAAETIDLRSMRGVSLGDRLACYPDEIAFPLARYTRWHLGCDPAIMHESAAVPLAINRVFLSGVDPAAIASAKRSSRLADELLGIPRAMWNYTNNVEASLPVGGFTAMLRQCREALKAIGVMLHEQHSIPARQALEEHSVSDVLVWAASPMPLFKPLGVPLAKSLPKKFSTYIFEAQWTGPVPFYVHNFTAAGSCFRVYIYESAGKVLLTAECVAETSTDALAGDIRRMLNGFEGKLKLGDMIHTSVKPRWIYHTVDTMTRLSSLRATLRARTGGRFIPGAWEAYAKGDKFSEVSNALAVALGAKRLRAA